MVYTAPCLKLLACLHDIVLHWMIWFKNNKYSLKNLSNKNFKKWQLWFRFHLNTLKIGCTCISLIQSHWKLFSFNRTEDEFGLIFLILNMIIWRRFTGPTCVLSVPRVFCRPQSANRWFSQWLDLDIWKKKDNESRVNLLHSEVTWASWHLKSTGNSTLCTTSCSGRH